MSHNFSLIPQEILHYMYTSTSFFSFVSFLAAVLCMLLLRSVAALQRLFSLK